MKWMLSFLRVLKWKLCYGSRFAVSFSRGKKPVYIGKGCVIRIGPKGRVVLDSGVYLSEYVVLEADGESSVSLGEGVFLNTFSRIYAKEAVTIGKGCMLGSNVSVYDHDHDVSQGVRNAGSRYAVAPVVMEDHVWCGTNAVVTKGSHVHSNTVIGANAVARGTLEGGYVYAGVPIKRLHRIQDAD